MKYNISAYSTALFSTWINVEELGLLIDAGDGVSAGLLQKAGKIKNVFITHPDRDHLTGLAQFVQLNSRQGFPKIHYPKDSGSFPALQNFLQTFDTHVKLSEWIPIEDKSKIEIKKNIFVEAIRNEHVECPIGVHKSLSYKVFEVKKKLKTAFQSLSQKEIKEIVVTHGKDHISETISSNIISFSGDTPVDNYEKWNGSEALIHEATFLKNEKDIDIKYHGNKHSTIEEVMKMVAEIDVKNLILNHFSCRYSNEDIDSTVRNLIKKYGIRIPVHIIHPGELKRDILNSKTIN